jgi:hypothetical protein
LSPERQPISPESPESFLLLNKAFQGYALMGRMNANPNEGDEYETHRFCSHHGCGYSGIVDSRLLEWTTKRDVHNNANHRYITTTTNNYINANHQDKDKVNMS